MVDIFIEEYLFILPFKIFRPKYQRGSSRKKLIVKDRVGILIKVLNYLSIDFIDAYLFYDNKKTILVKKRY